MNIDVIFKIAAIGIIISVINQILTRSGREEFTMITTIAGLIAVLMMLIPYIKDFFTYIKSVFDLYCLR